MPGNFGLGGFGITPYGGAADPFGVLEARSIGQKLVQVVFNDLLDMASPYPVSPSSYTLDPPCAVHAVSFETAGSVRLTTDFLSAAVYTVTVVGPTTYTGRPMDDALRTATFVGFPIAKSYQPVAVSYRKVRLLFQDPMIVNAALTDPASYRIRTHTGVNLPITRVTAEGPPTAPMAVALDLGADLIQRGVHTSTILSAFVQSQGGIPPQPSGQDFHWVAPTLHTSVPIRIFTGELRGGLLGQHNGLVFFSPAYNNPAPNSAIQVDSVTVSTRAYDVYKVPSQSDAGVLYTFKPGMDSGKIASKTRGTFASFDKLGGAKFEFHDLHKDQAPAPLDGTCIATLTETLDGTRTPRLNVMGYHAAAPHLRPVWPLFDGVSATPFTTAANLTPIPPGPTTTIVLEP